MIKATYLNQLADQRAAASSLLPRVKAATPTDGYVHVGLIVDLKDALAGRPVGGDRTGGVVVVADTLTVSEDVTDLGTAAIQLIARRVVTIGKPVIRLSPGAGLEILTSELGAGLGVDTGTAPNLCAPAFTDPGRPHLLDYSTDGLTSSKDTSAVADVFHEPWSLLGLQLSYTAATSLSQNQTDAEAMGEATAMIRWVLAGSEALMHHQGLLSAGDQALIGDLRASATGLLTFTQAAASGAVYVPALAAEMYQNEIVELIGLAKTYDQKITALDDASIATANLEAMAATLQSINDDARKPLLNTLRRLTDQAANLRLQLQQETLNLSRVTKDIPDLQEELQKAVEQKFQDDLLKSALNTLFNLAELYVGIGAALIDPAMTGEALGKMMKEVLKASAEVAELLLEKGQEALEGIIEGGLNVPDIPSSSADDRMVANGGRALAGVQASLGVAMNAIWMTVRAATTKGNDGEINFTPNLISILDNVPDLSQFSVGGVDATTYWDASVARTKTATAAYRKPDYGGEVNAAAEAYLGALELAAAYGRGVGNLQAKLTDLFFQTLDAFNRLRTIHEADARWNALLGNLKNKDEQLAAARGLLHLGADAVRRNIILAVDQYRAAFYYQWLQPSPLHAEITMSLPDLQGTALNASAGLREVLTQKAGGKLKPQQDFNGLEYRVEAHEGFLFQEKDGKGVASWSILPGDEQLRGQLDGNTALFLTQVRVELIGAEQTGEVELTLASSSQYQNKKDTQAFRFVAAPISATINYFPEKLPSYVSTWKFADPSSYLKPTPYTDWTLTVDKGNWKNVTALKLTFDGVFLQNQ